MHFGNRQGVRAPTGSAQSSPWRWVMIIAALMIGATVLVTSTAAYGLKNQEHAFSGDAPGSVICVVMAKVSFSPPLTDSGGGTRVSKVKSRVSGCVSNDSAVTINRGRLTGSFSKSPLSCVTRSDTGASPAITISWKGEVNGTVDATTYAGKAKFVPTTVRGENASGSFAGLAALNLKVPLDMAALCGSRGGIKKLMLTGTLAEQGPTIGTTGTSLQTLGSPTVSSSCVLGGDSYSSAPPSTLEMGGQQYDHGFQLATDQACEGGNDQWSWHIGGLYRTLTAAIGLDTRNSTGATVQFLNGTTPMTFSADGQSLTATNLVAGLPTVISMNITHLLNLTVKITPNSFSASATVDFANDSMTGASFVTPPVTGTSLQTLGSPTVSSSCVLGGDSYSSAPPSTLEMGGQQYDHGFQLATDQACEGGNDQWSWHIGGLYRTLTAAIGLDPRNSTGATVQFLNGTTPMTFSADGQSLTATNLVAGLPTVISMNITHLLNLTVKITPNSFSASAMVDFANDSMVA